MLQPTAITIFTETGTLTGKPANGEFCEGDLAVTLTERSGGTLSVAVRSDTTEIRYLQLRFAWDFAAEALFCGDAWERAYGDLHWAGCNPSRPLPWYFLAAEAGRCVGFGVRVRPKAFALWYADRRGATLLLDVRNGDRGLRLAGRLLEAAEVVHAVYPEQTPFLAAQAFCRQMSRGALPIPEPVYGGNNWYYAYGNSSHTDILRDCAGLTELTAALPNRPFMVIDDGWELNYDHASGRNAGPWDRGNAAFPDMAALADEMRTLGIKPGIWFRPLWNLDPTIPAECKTATGYLDISHPEVADRVSTDIRRLSDWGYQLIKHDFSTRDIFGKWGFQMTGFPGESGLRFFDRSRSTAEIVTDFYRTILMAAGDSLILGCNTIGHLGAGLMHLARTGDDTSGKYWDRTRKMGVNTLAFRMAQHRVFFDVDADCVGITGEIPWRLNRQWSELLAQSGTPFFASIRPGVLDPEAKMVMRHCFCRAASSDAVAEPVDWLINANPSCWRINGRDEIFDWHEAAGSTPEFILSPPGIA